MNKAYMKFTEAEDAADKEFSAAFEVASAARNKIWDEKVKPLEEARRVAIKEGVDAEEAIVAPARTKLLEAMQAASAARNKIWDEKVKPLEEARRVAIKEGKDAEEAIVAPARTKLLEAMQAAWDVYRRTSEYEAEQATRYLK